MTRHQAAAPVLPADDRRRRLLEAARVTFLRFGFKKTSMGEVARAADVSRQALYLHFPTKEEMFRSAVRYFLETGLAGASARLGDDQPVEKKLSGGFDEWVGRYVGMVGADVADLEVASKRLVGSLIVEHEEAFVDMVTKTIRGSGLPRAYRPRGLKARQLAEMLCATARGLKHGCATRAEFAERFDVAVRVLCAPLRERA
jgi:AcrR family transcriptional regulator